MMQQQARQNPVWVRGRGVNISIPIRRVWMVRLRARHSQLWLRRVQVNGGVAERLIAGTS